MSQVHTLIQGSPEWQQFRLEHHGASEAAAMLGISKLTKRTELLKMKKTGNAKVFSDWVQKNILDHGHHVESLARPIMEGIISAELYPVTMSDGKISASCDGLTMDDRTAFEHKQWNATLAAQVEAGVVPDEHMPQCQQILMVTGAEEVLFTVSDGTPERLVYARVQPDPTWFKRIRDGWAQFDADLAAFEVEAPVLEAVGRTPDNLPALHIEVTGMVTASNLEQYRDHALTVFKAINRELTTDQHFADAEKTVKWCADIESRLSAAKQHALSQTKSIDALFNTIDSISAEARATRLELDKLVKMRKEQVRNDIVMDGQKAFAAHVASLNKRLGKSYMPAIGADFATAIKGKKTVDSLRDAANTCLANAKIAANAVADKIQINLNTLRDLGTEHAFLFADAAQIVLKDPDDLTMLVKSRISDHEAKEAARLEAERARIRREEEAKAQAAAAEAVRKAEEEAAAKARQAEPVTLAVVAEAVMPEPVAQVISAPRAESQPAPQVVRTAPTPEPMDDISRFLASRRDWSLPERNRFRVVLTEYETFKAMQRQLVAA